MCETENQAFVLPGKIIILKVDEEDHGLYIYIKDVVRDINTKNRVGWIVYYIPLWATKNWEPLILDIRVNDEHIRGEAFTVNGEFRQFCEVDFEVKTIKPFLKLVK